MARLTLNSGESVGLSSGTYNIFGTSAGKETVTIAAAATVTLDASFNAGGDTVTLAGNAADYTAVRSGSSLILTHTSGGVVTIPVGTTASTVAFADASRSLVFNTTSSAVELGSQAVTSTAAAVSAGTGGSAAGQTVTLTTGVDVGSKFVGGASNDTFRSYDGETGAGIVNALGAADRIDGGAGIDTLEVIASGQFEIASTTVAKSIEILNVTSLDDVDVSPSATNFASLTDINVLAAAEVIVDAADTTNVSVSGATGAAVEVDGGNNVTVSSAKAGQDISIGATTEAAGVVSVTHVAQTTGDIVVEGGTNVTVVAANAVTGEIAIGANVEATGAVVVTSTGAAYTAATSVALGAISVTGGSSVSVTQTAASSTAKAVTDGAAADRTQSDVSVDANGATTSVTITQDAGVTAVNALAAVTKVNEVQTVTFGELLEGESVEIGGLTYTATADNDADEVAAAFANLVTGATTGGNPSSLGIYTGSWTAEHSSGAAVNTGTTAAPVWKVTFTGSGAATDLAFTTDDGTGAAAAGDNATFATLVTKAGVDAVTGKAGVMGVVGGAFTITDGGDKLGNHAVATVSLTGFGAASSITSDALSKLTVNSSVADLTISNGEAEALTLNVSGYGTSKATPTLDIGATYTSIAIDTGSVAGSDFTLDGADLESLTVSGSKSLDLNASTLASLETVKVTGAAGLTATALTDASYDTTGTTGTVSVTIDADVATYKGGAGVDKVTTTGGASEDVSLGAGDDTLTFADSEATGLLSGGVGTDTLVMASADAAAAAANALFGAQISDFEKLSLKAVGAGDTDTVNLANVDAISYVISAGTGVGSTLNIDKMATGGTVELTGANAGLIDVDFVSATGKSDSLNVIAKVTTADIDFGTIDISGIETLVLTASDSDTSLATGGGVDLVTLEVTDTSLKSVVASGSASLDLTVGAAVTTIDGSGLTGSLTVASNGAAAAATTITGGAGADELTANGNGDILKGGAGNDDLIVKGDLVTLTGGAGADVFDVSNATSNSNTYATITDLAAGDKILLDVDTKDFASAAVTLASTASFDAYVNAAIAAGGQDGAAWFKFGGDTYVVQNVGAASAAFENGTDIIAKIEGTYNLATAALNTDSNWLVVG